MSVVPILFGLLIVVLGVAMCIRPDSVYGLLNKYGKHAGLHLIAVLSRFLLGAALILTATESSFPTTMRWLGWLAVAAAVVFAVIGRSRFRALITWATDNTRFYGRYAGLVAVLFGGFLVYSYV